MSDNKTNISTIHTVLAPIKVNHTTSEIDDFISSSLNGFIMVECGPEELRTSALIRIENIILVESNKPNL